MARSNIHIRFPQRPCADSVDWSPAAVRIGDFFEFESAFPGSSDFFQIFRVRVNGPHIMFFAQYVAHRKHCSDHGMVLIVVLMQPVSPYGVQIVKRIQMSADYFQSGFIGGVIDRVGFGHSNNGAVQYGILRG